MMTGGKPRQTWTQLKKSRGLLFTLAVPTFFISTQLYLAKIV